MVRVNRNELLKRIALTIQGGTELQLSYVHGRLGGMKITASVSVPNDPAAVANAIDELLYDDFRGNIRIIPGTSEIRVVREETISPQLLLG